VTQGSRGRWLLCFDSAIEADTRVIRDPPTAMGIRRTSNDSREIKARHRQRHGLTGRVVDSILLLIHT
jgi:hypothetical protein